MNPYKSNAHYSQSLNRINDWYDCAAYIDTFVNMQVGMYSTLGKLVITCISTELSLKFAVFFGRFSAQH